MKRFVFVALFLSFFGFSSSVLAYDTCSPYHYYNNSNPTLPCSYNGYNYDSLAVEAGVNSFFYRGSEYALFDHEWWWALVSQTYETCDGLMVAWGSYNCSHNLSFNKSGALFFGPGASFGEMLTIIRSPEMGGGVSDYPAGENIYCGISGYNLCQAVFPPDTQVTLDAYPNEGYVFSHWEINNQTMGDVDGEITIAMSEDKEVVAVFKRVLGWPLDGSPDTRTILSVFGDDWLESCGGEIMKHTGIDIGATTTDVVYAAEDGIVKVAQTDQQWGGWVTIEHDSLNNPFTTTYIHVTPSVSYNDPVDKGDPIGTVVNYGGPVHLHFGLRNGVYNNTSNRGRLPQSVCGGDPAFQENFENPSDFLFE